MKQLEVQIMGQSYRLGCPEGGEARLLEAVKRVDEAMCRIRDAGKIRARERIAVLAALNLAFDLPDPEESSPPSFEPSPAADAQPASAAAPADPDNNAVLRSLVTRLDQALGDDGRLL